MRELNNELKAAEIRLAERRAALKEHEKERTTSRSREDAEQQLHEMKATRDLALDTLSRSRSELARDDDARDRQVTLRGELESQTHRWQTWAAMKELIGSSDGAKLRRFAQSLTLEALIGHANRHLGELARRFALQRVPDSDLELQVVDRDMADEVRSVFSLSGGESFLVSLAMALGLASLNSQRTRVESLFIDEGFGSLDADALETAVASLDALQSLGRQVGIISHVSTLVERIGFQVQVTRGGGGRSTVRTSPAR
jgi:exonuclease SbcC